jgi:anaerobic ribonucleoside-triphosphate reductase activating protein
MKLELAARVPVTRAEGPHERFAVWLQGCSLRCPGCCNPELFERGRGQLVEVEALVTEIDAARRTHAIVGVTLLGGEPLEQLAGVTELAAAIHARGLGLILFSGYARAEADALPGFERLWPSIDTLVDGRFVAREREPAASAGGRRFIGSRNQVLHHRTDRYADPQLWRGSPTLELRIDPSGAIDLHGDPALARALTRLLVVGGDAGLLGP